MELNQDKLKAIEESLAQIRGQAAQMTARVAAEGITTNTGEFLVQPQRPAEGTIRAEEIGDTPELPNISRVAEASQKASQQILDFSRPYADLVGRYEQFQKASETRLAELEKQKTETETEQKKWFEFWKGETETRPSQAQILEEERKRWGIPETWEQVQSVVPEITGLRMQLTELNTQEMEELEKVKSQQGVGMRFIEGQTGATARKYELRRSALSAELGAKVALMETLRGNLSTAQQFVDRTIANLTYDQEQKYQDIKDLMNTYGSLVDGLDKESQTILKNMEQNLKEELDLAKDERKFVMDLMLKYPQSGIIPTDDIEDAYTKAKDYVATLPETMPAITEKERFEATTRDWFSKAEAQLRNSIGTDGYVDSQAYLRLRNELAKNFPTRVSTFDSSFAPMLSPEERARLGVGRAVGVEAAKDFFEEIMFEAIQESMK